MHKLDQHVIADLAHKYHIATLDAPRQAIVDSLGMHPVNHAWFARFLADYHPNDWQVYLALTKAL